VLVVVTKLSDVVVVLSAVVIVWVVCGVDIEVVVELAVGLVDPPKDSVLDAEVCRADVELVIIVLWVEMIITDCDN